MQVELRLRGGQHVLLEVDDRATGRVGFVLGIARSGSTLLNQIVHALATANDEHFVDVGTHFFDAGVAEPDFNRDPAILGLMRPGNIYGGFRYPPSVLAWSPFFLDGSKVLMVRDPRDALVSLYFSDLWSHPVPRGSSKKDDLTWRMHRRRAWARLTSIDSYVLGKARHVADVMRGYIPLLNTSTARVLRYEDFVFDKPSLVAAVAEHFGWKAPSHLIAEIVQAVDVHPPKEDPTSFVRQVLPGDHQAKLRPATIERLDRLLADVMRPFRYAPSRPRSGANASASDRGPV